MGKGNEQQAMSDSFVALVLLYGTMRPVRSMVEILAEGKGPKETTL